jgi:exodeoxyribonuclease VII large subunit
MALAAVRLQPVLLTRPIAEKQERLAAFARLAEQLHPERPLQRGYVMVVDARGAAVTDRATARKEPGLTLRFRDGPLDVVPATDPRPPRAKTAPPSGEQPKLL